MPAIIALAIVAILGGVLLNPSGAVEGAKAEYRSAKAMGQYRPKTPVARQAPSTTSTTRRPTAASGSISSQTRWTRMSNESVSPEMARFAREVLELYGKEPRGSMYAKKMNSGEIVAGRLEEHYHSPESGKTPVGYHTGVTLFEAID